MQQSWLSASATTGSAGAKGLGIFSSRVIPAGTTVAGFGGNVVERTEFDTLDEALRTHSLQIDEHLYMVSLPPFAPADLVNHSCEPNCGIIGSCLFVTMTRHRGRRGAVLRLRDDRHERLRRVRVRVRHRVVPRPDHRRRLEAPGAAGAVRRLLLVVHHAQDRGDGGTDATASRRGSEICSPAASFSNSSV